MVIQRKWHYLGTDGPTAHRKYADLIDANFGDRTEAAPRTLSGIVQVYMDREGGPADRLNSFIDWANQGVAIASWDVHEETIVDYLHALEKRELANSTKRDYVNAALQVLRWAHRRGWVNVIPDRPRIGAAIRNPKDIPVLEVMPRIARIKSRVARDLLTFIATTGCRPIEARFLEWSEVRLDRSVCIISEHKTQYKVGESRTIYLTPQAIDILKNRPRIDGQPLVFPSSTGEAYTKDGIRAITRRVGFNPYQLRHTFAQFILDQGHDISIVQGHLGHKDLNMALVYARQRDGRLRASAGALFLPTHDGPM